MISFQQSFTHHVPSLFPSDLTFISSAFLLAPFWSDVDISIYGSIFYEVHRGANSSLIAQVNRFISNHTENDFTGTWMLVAHWDQVREYPGLFSIAVSRHYCFFSVHMHKAWMRTNSDFIIWDVAPLNF